MTADNWLVRDVIDRIKTNCTATFVYVGWARKFFPVAQADVLEHLNTVPPDGRVTVYVTGGHVFLSGDKPEAESDPVDNIRKTLTDLLIQHRTECHGNESIRPVLPVIEVTSVAQCLWPNLADPYKFSVVMKDEAEVSVTREFTGTLPLLKGQVIQLYHDYLQAKSRYHLDRLNKLDEDAESLEDTIRRVVKENLSIDLALEYAKAGDGRWYELTLFYGNDKVSAARFPVND